MCALLLCSLGFFDDPFLLHFYVLTKLRKFPVFKGKSMGEDQTLGPSSSFGCAESKKCKINSPELTTARRIFLCCQGSVTKHCPVSIHTILNLYKPKFLNTAAKNTHFIAVFGGFGA